MFGYGLGASMPSCLTPNNCTRLVAFFFRFYGSYDALSSGQISEAFMLITGGFCWRSKPVKFASDAKVKLMKKQIIDCLVKKESMLAVVSKTEGKFLK